MKGMTALRDGHRASSAGDPNLAGAWTSIPVPLTKLVVYYPSNKASTHDHAFD